MCLGKKKVSIILLMCFFVTYCTAPLSAYAAPKAATRVLTVSGEVSAIVDENGSPSSSALQNENLFCTIWLESNVPAH